MKDSNLNMSDVYELVKSCIRDDSETFRKFASKNNIKKIMQNNLDWLTIRAPIIDYVYKINDSVLKKILLKYKSNIIDATSTYDSKNISIYAVDLHYVHRDDIVIKQTAWYTVCRYDYADLLKRLIDSDREFINYVWPNYQSDINDDNIRDYTIMHILCHSFENSVNCLELLIKNGADMDRMTHYGTAAQISMFQNHLRLLEILIRGGASIDIRDNDNFTLIDYIMGSCHNNNTVLKLLRIVYQCDFTMKDVVLMMHMHDLKNSISLIDKRLSDLEKRL